MEGTNGSQQITARYKHLKQTWEQKSNRLKTRSHLIGWLRLLLFTASFVIPFTFFETWGLAFFLVFIIFLMSFLALVFYAHILNRRRQKARIYSELYSKELRILNDNWTDEADGAEWIDPHHDFAHDLDIFGKGSLFQYLNRTATKEGSKKLANKLQSISLDAKDVKNKQEAIVELAANASFREQFFVAASMVEEGRKKKKEFNLAHQPDLSFVSGKFRYLIMAFPIITLAVVVLSSINIISSSSILYLFLGGLAITGHYLRKVNRVHNEVSNLGRYLSNYAKLITLTENLPVKSLYLKQLKVKLTSNDQPAGHTVKQLGQIIQFLDQRFNMLMGAMLNGFFLWDLMVCVALRKWYKHHGTQFAGWMDSLHEIEALNSFATFTYNHPECCLPQFSITDILQATDLGHPLIPFRERINNNFSIDGEKRICVVTGANMAGKSTFLRTIGVNLILAGNGCAVSARSFIYKPVTFVTNMRAVDNLLKHESYFFAELSRLQMIVERLKSKGEIFFILDEILKGTNSHDKTSGSIALIKQLLLLNGSGIVATHDLELGQLSQSYEGKIFNKCFEVTFDNEDLQFDYKLRDGITHSHNASFLMRKMGLIPDDYNNSTK